MGAVVFVDLLLLLVRLLTHLDSFAVQRRDVLLLMVGILVLGVEHLHVVSLSLDELSRILIEFSEVELLDAVDLAHQFLDPLHHFDFGYLELLIILVDLRE